MSHDALYNRAAKFRYMFGGKARAPLVMRGMIGAGFSAAAQHSQSPYNIFCHHAVAEGGGALDAL